ncbi:MAG: hypothetical protein JXB50_14145, partial [Spirochaetes bacterium]|nr:hypothetical protein [Spirochaetota bacterium]
MKKRILTVLIVLSFILLTIWFNCNPFQDQSKSLNSDLNVLDETDVIRASQADNPLFRTFRSADASPLVYNGRYYIVCGQDEVNTNAFDMYSWRLLSSADMSSWTDHGVILRPSSISWIP